MLDAAHGVDCAGDDGAGLVGAFVCLAGNGAGFVGALGRAADIDRDLVEGGGGFFQRRGLLFGAT
ncbi:hypothetical protein D3C71_1955450 [compost metagenome]